MIWRSRRKPGETNWQTDNTTVGAALRKLAAIRGGASLVHGVQMRNVAEKMSM